MLESPFDKHGVTHLSASSLKLYREEPAAWVMRYLMRMRDDAGPSAWRGNAVEAGLDILLLKAGDVTTASAVAHAEFMKLSQGETGDKIEKERDLLNSFLLTAYEAAKDLPPLLTRQSRISIELPGIEVPIVGYTDYDFGDFGVDLKTTQRMPSEARADHVEQMAIYMRAKKKPFKLLYVTPKKHALYEVTADMARAAMVRVEAGARAVRHLLAKSLDASDALDFFSPDYEAFYWTPETRQAAQSMQHRNNTQ